MKIAVRVVLGIIFSPIILIGLLFISPFVIIQLMATCLDFVFTGKWEFDPPDRRPRNFKINPKPAGYTKPPASPAPPKPYVVK